MIVGGVAARPRLSYESGCIPSSPPLGLGQAGCLSGSVSHMSRRGRGGRIIRNLCCPWSMDRRSLQGHPDLINQSRCRWLGAQERRPRLGAIVGRPHPIRGCVGILVAREPPPCASSPSWQRCSQPASPGGLGRSPPVPIRPCWVHLPRPLTQQRMGRFRPKMVPSSRVRLPTSILTPPRARVGMNSWCP